MGLHVFWIALLLSIIILFFFILSMFVRQSTVRKKPTIGVAGLLVRVLSRMAFHRNLHQSDRQDGGKGNQRVDPASGPL